MIDDAPLTYDDIKALATALNRPAKTLIALAPGNDPFYVLPRRQTAAEWFATEIWPLLLNPEGGIHVRRVHPVLVSLPDVRKPDGTAYENTLNDWRLLIDASRDARELGLVDAGLFIDRRAAEPIVYIPEDEDSDADVIVYGKIDEPAAETAPFISYRSERHTFPELPGYSVSSPRIVEPYAIEIWVEKSTMADVLEPIARRHGVTLITGVGELSLTRVHEHIERVIAHGRKARVIYLSDFDPAGSDMPVSIARKIEFLLRSKDLDLDIRLDPLLLTREQVEHYRLPRIPIKDGERRKAKFEERFGEGATELDALEALHPGELARLVIKRIEVYREPTQVARGEIREAASELRQEGEEIRREVLDEHADALTRLRREFDQMQATIATHQAALTALADEFRIRVEGEAAEHIETINAATEQFYAQAHELWAMIRDDLEERAPDPDAVDWPIPEDADEFGRATIPERAQLHRADRPLQAPSGQTDGPSSAQRQWARTMNRRARRRAAALSRKSERIRSRHNAFFETYIRHLPEVPLDAPLEPGRVYHAVIAHDDNCRFYATERLADCNCDPLVKRFVGAEAVMTQEDEIRIENIVETVVTGVRGPGGNPLPLSVLREFSKHALQIIGVPIPKDGWLDEFIIEMADWHEIAVEGSA